MQPAKPLIRTMIELRRLALRHRFTIKRWKLPRGNLKQLEREMGSSIDEEGYTFCLGVPLILVD